MDGRSFFGRTYGTDSYYDYGRTLVELGPENDDSDIRFGDSEGFAAASAETQPLDGEYDFAFDHTQPQVATGWDGLACAPGSGSHDGDGEGNNPSIHISPPPDFDFEPFNNVIPQSNAAMHDPHHIMRDDSNSNPLKTEAVGRRSSPMSNKTTSERGILEPGFTIDNLVRDPRRASADIRKNARGMWDCQERGCETLAFPRKCEWRKHMDTHDKPWICPHPDCRERDGFTWKGGLKRHLQEVHLINDDSSRRHVCPKPECKRSTGPGFKRKENLIEHVKSVHAAKFDDLAEQHRPGTMSDSDESMDRSTSEEKSAMVASPSPATTTANHVYLKGITQTPMKRKYSHRAPKEDDQNSDEYYEVPSVEASRENKRLRHELDHANRQIGLLEDVIVERDLRILQLKQALKTISNEMKL